MRSIHPATTSTNRWRRAAVLVSTAVLLTAGCGSSDSSDSASTDSSTPPGDPTTTTAAPEPDPAEDGGSEEGSGDACDIVSDDVVAEVLGVEIARREANEVPGQTVSCLKGTERVDDLTNAYYVSVNVVANGTALVDTFSAEAGSQPVEGLGDRAVYVPGAGVLAIADGTDSVAVQVVKAGVPGTQDDAVTVAEDVFDRRG